MTILLQPNELAVDVGKGRETAASIQTPDYRAYWRNLNRRYDAVGLDDATPAQLKNALGDYLSFDEVMGR